MISASAKRSLRNFLVVGFPNVFQTGAMFLRGVILARLLSVEEFGLAVIVISITGALDTFADAGIDRFVVQHRFGYRADILRTSHAFRVFGSLVVGLGIVAVAYPLALIFDVPDLWPALAATGGVVCLRGFVNLSYKLQQREHRFEAETVIDVSRVGADLLVAGLVALLTGSFLAALAGAYANALVHLALSHLKPRATYGFLPSRRAVPLVRRFSLPIYLNATMLFAAMQGDRMIVGAMFNKRNLAEYAVACTVGQGIATLVGKVAERLLLPAMVDRRIDQAKRRARINKVGLVMITGSLLFWIGVSLFGPSLTHAIYGSEYRGLGTIVSAAAIFQMIQMQQSWLNSVLMAEGETRHFPKITLMRATAFPTAILLVGLGYSLISIPIAFAIGSAASLAYSFWAAGKLKLIDGRLPLIAFGIIAATLAVVMYLA